MKKIIFALLCLLSQHLAFADKADVCKNFADIIFGEKNLRHIVVFTQLVNPIASRNTEVMSAFRKFETEQFLEFIRNSSRFAMLANLGPLGEDVPRVFFLWDEFHYLFSPAGTNNRSPSAPVYHGNVWVGIVDSAYDGNGGIFVPMYHLPEEISTVERFPDILNQRTLFYIPYPNDANVISLDWGDGDRRDYLEHFAASDLGLIEDIKLLESISRANRSDNAASIEIIKKTIPALKTEFGKKIAAAGIELLDVERTAERYTPVSPPLPTVAERAAGATAETRP